MWLNSNVDRYVYSCIQLKMGEIGPKIAYSCHGQWLIEKFGFAVISQRDDGWNY